MSRFRRRLMGLAALRQAAADDFVRVEYLENVSNAYIDTFIKPNNNTRIEAEFSFNRFDDTYSQFIFGARTSLSSNKFYIINDVRTQIINWHYRINNSKGNVDIQINEKWKVSNNGGTLTYTNGTNTYTLSVANGSFSCPHSITIFAMNNNGVPTLGTNSFNGKFYSFKIYNGSTLVRDFIPMYQKSKDLYGLWDRVKEEFYVSPNGVKFTGGERVIADADENLYYLKNYVNVSNNQRKDLGFQPVGNDSWEGKFYFSGTGRQDILGAWNSQGQRQYGFMGIDNRQMRFLYNTQTIYSTTAYGNKTFTLKAEKNKFYIYDANNKLIWSNSAIYTSGNNPVRNFIVGHLNGSVYASNARMYYFKYMRGDNLVWDLIPVQRCSDKVWGIFCKVHNSFYESDGGTAFSGG